MYSLPVTSVTSHICSVQQSWFEFKDSRNLSSVACQLQWTASNQDHTHMTNFAYINHIHVTMASKMNRKLSVALLFIDIIHMLQINFWEYQKTSSCKLQQAKKSANCLQTKPYMSNINHMHHIHAAWFSKLTPHYHFALLLIYMIICDDVLQLYSMSLAVKRLQLAIIFETLINYFRRLSKIKQVACWLQCQLLASKAIHKQNINYMHDSWSLKLIMIAS